MKLAEELRNRLLRDEVILGTFIVEMKTPAVAPILKNCGYGYYLIDLEHGCFEPHEIGELISAGKRYGICPMARVAGPDRERITQVLDAGAEGIVVAMVRSMEDVQNVVSATKYPPLGRRGIHMLRPHTDFSPPSDNAIFMERANRTLITGVQIETLEAVDLIEEIAATPGVDMLYVGPADLSAAIGYPGMMKHPKLMEIAERVGRACNTHGKIAAYHSAEPEVLTQLIPQGFRMFGHAAALRLFWSGAQTFMDNFKINVETINQDRK